MRPLWPPHESIPLPHCFSTHPFLPLLQWCALQSAEAEAVCTLHALFASLGSSTHACAMSAASAVAVSAKHLAQRAAWLAEALAAHAPATAAVDSTAPAPAPTAPSHAPAKPLVNLVVIGHVDSGKSTLTGHLLYLSGRIDAATLHRLERDSRAQGKASFHFAWCADEHESERQRGVTTDVAVKSFATPHRRVTLLDAPGHKDFVPTMLSGAAAADSALLLVSAARGEFEAGFGAAGDTTQQQQQGQTREHCILARALGVKRLVVVVSKLETVEWSRARYDDVSQQVLTFARTKAGFRDEQLCVCPCSAMSGENLAQRSADGKLSEWYAGPTLLQVIDALQPQPLQTDRPLRMCVADVFKASGAGGGALTLAGRVDSGYVCKGDSLLLLPAGEVLSVKSLSVESSTSPASANSASSDVNIALSGEQVRIAVKDVSDAAVLTVGSYLCHPSHPIPTTQRLVAQVQTLHYTVPLLKGTTCLLYMQSFHCEVSISKLVSLLDRATGVVCKAAPRLLPRDSAAVLELSTVRSAVVCAETYASCREMGRLTLRRDGETVAVGIVTALVGT